MKRRFAVIVFAMIIGSTASGARAEDQIRRLSLEEATKIALYNNFDIQLTRYDAWIAQTDKDVAESIYDTILTAEAQYRNDQSRQASTIAGTKALDNDYNIGVSQKLPTGTTLSVDMANSRRWTDSAFTTSPLTHDSTLGVTVEQDLGKNIFGIQDRGDVKVTLADIAGAEYTSLDKIEESVVEVQQAYWDLVLEKAKVAIEEAMTAEAKKLYDLHQEKLKDGLVEIPEAIASEANYKTRKNALMLARSRLQAKAGELKLLLDADEDAAIEPADYLRLPEKGGQNLTESLRKAFAHRQDYKKARNDIDSREIKLSMQKNNLWPEINLTATLEQNGLGDHFKQAATRITDENNPDFFAGLTVTFPLQNRDARGELEAARLKRAKAVLALKQLERRIAVDVADRVRDCNVFGELAVNNDVIAELQARKLEEEHRRFSTGRSDTDTLIRFQEDLVQARGAVVEAIHRHHTALVDLAREEGVLLEQYWNEDE